MTLTASDVASLTSRIEGWEYAEYIFTALVAIACFGEYIADFTEWWRGKRWKWFGDLKHRKDRVAKLSTIVLIAALALELLCVVKTNRLSGELVGALADRSEEAFTKSGNALRTATSAVSQSGSAAQQSIEALGKSTEATKAASAAVLIAGVARKEANSVEKDVAAAKLRLLDLTARHVLILDNEPEILNAIGRFKGQKIDLESCGKRLGDETSFLYGAIVDVLNKAKWDVLKVVPCIHDGIGVSVKVNTGSSSATVDAANALGRILTKLLRTYDSKTFDGFDKLREQQKDKPWGWILPVSSDDPPLERETVRVQILAQFPR